MPDLETLKNIKVDAEHQCDDLSDETDNEPGFPSALLDLFVVKESLVKHKESEEDEIGNEVNFDDLLFVKLPKELEDESNDFDSKDVNVFCFRKSYKKSISLIVIKNPIIFDCINIKNSFLLFFLHNLFRLRRLWNFFFYFFFLCFFNKKLSSRCFQIILFDINLPFRFCFLFLFLQFSLLLLFQLFLLFFLNFFLSFFFFFQSLLFLKSFKFFFLFFTHDTIF